MKRINRTDPDFAERFWVRVEIGEPDECWPWTKGRTSTGYGAIGFEGTSDKAHRIAYELSFGPIPEETVVDHTCHNTDTACPGGSACLHRRCQNPGHLEAVGFGENIRRGRTGAHFSDRTHCSNGHEYTPENLLTGPSEQWRRCRECNKKRCAVYDARRRGKTSTEGK